MLSKYIMSVVERKDVKAAWDLYCFVTIVGVAMMASWKISEIHHRHYCSECGYEIMLDSKTDKVNK